jgi:hypothetical protein
MTTESVYELFCDLDLRQHIVDTAKRLTHDRRVQKELVGHAWYVLGEAPAQRTIAYYKRYALLRMEKRMLLIRWGEIIIT